MNARRYTLKALAAGLALGFSLIAPVAQAQDKGTVGVAMPTKTSTRWVNDGNSMVAALAAKGYKSDLLDVKSGWIYTGIINLLFGGGWICESGI